MTPQAQQALSITQAAVGQLQGMFKRLAGKMEVDVATLKTGLQDAIRAVQSLRQEVQGLRAEVAQLRGAQAPVSKAAPRPATKTTFASADGKPSKAEVLSAPIPSPEVLSESEDAVFFSGED